MAIKKAEISEGLTIDALKQGRVTLRMIGTTPFYFNSMSVKVKRDLLLGGGRKTTAQKREIKHHPLQEFRDSVYRMSSGPTLLGFPAPGVKNAMATAALETAGVTKTSVNRLVFLPQERVSIWGKPKIRLDVVRSADMNKTPDIRSRAYLPRWCSQVEVAFVSPTLSAHSIVSLLANAGVICGLGDFRQEKGKGGFGTFAVAVADHMGDWGDIWDEITAEDRVVQEEAMDDPEPADDDTAELLRFYAEEVAKRAA